MGWCGTRKDYKTNLDNIKYDVLYGKTENEEYFYKEFCQRGSNVFVLIQNKESKEYFVDVFMCRTVRSHGYSEFQWRGESAICEHFYDFPKRWISLLDQEDKYVKEYIKGREEYEQKKKSAYTPKLNDLFKCTSTRDVTWGGYTIVAGEEFFIKYNGWYGHRYFMLSDKNGKVSPMKITRKSFNSFNKELVCE